MTHCASHPILSKWSPLVTTSFVQPAESGRPGTAAAILVALLAGTAILGLFVAGVTFLALAVAFPIIVPLANQLHIAISANDLALAEQLAGVAWIFGALALSSVVGAVVVAVKTIQVLSPAPGD